VVVTFLTVGTCRVRRRRSPAFRPQATCETSFFNAGSAEKKQTPKDYARHVEAGRHRFRQRVKVGDYDGYIAKVDLGKGNLKANMIAVI
jgi:hypothetical protein